MSIFDELRAGVTTHGPDESRALAARLAAALPPDSTIALHGSLGVGKTTFVQGLATGWDITAPVTSPTFPLFIVHRSAARTLVHLDAYRLDGPADLTALAIEEYLEPPWCLAVEWPDRVAGWLPPGTLHLDLSIEHGRSHRLHLRE